MNNQRSELSQSNKYWIPKYRYLELKNFCLQYPDWEKQIKEISFLKAKTEISTSGNFSNPTEKLAIILEASKSKMDLIETTAYLADPVLSKWILIAVTKAYTYEYLRYKLDMPAGRSMYYDRYRKFFYLLDQNRN